MGAVTVIEGCMDARDVNGADLKGVSKYPTNNNHGANRATYGCSIMSIIDCPPSPCHLVKGRTSNAGMPPIKPRLFLTDEMYHVDTRLKMAICRYVLVMSRRGYIVGEANAIVVVSKMHVDKALVGPVKRDPPLGHGHHGIIVSYVRSQNHDARVEKIRPSDVWRC